MMRHKWILIAALALGVPAMTPARALADRDDVRMEQVDFDRLPREVRRTFDHEGHGDRITKLVRIEYEGRISYRATFDDHGRERVMRVSRDGDVINEKELDRWGRLRDHDRNDVRETHQSVSFREIPEPARRVISREVPKRTIDNVEEVNRGGYLYYIVDSDNGRRIRVDRDGNLLSDNDPRLMSNVRSNRYWESRDIDRDWDELASGSYLRFEDLPGEVKQSIGSHTGQGDRVTDVVRLRDGGYLATVESGDGRFARMYRVDRSGRILSTRNATDEGAVSVRFNDLPGPVKDALNHQGEPREYRRILQVTRDGHTFYVGFLRDRDHDRVVRVDMRGERLD